MNREIKSLTVSEILELPLSVKETYGLVHTPQEILQQPATWLETFQIVKTKQVEIQAFLQKSGFDTDNFSVVLIGAGTSDYIGRALVSLLKRKWKCNVQAIPSTNLMTEMDEFIENSPVNTQYLWISFSRSGDSFEGVQVLEKTIKNYSHIKHLIVTCNETGKMANEIFVNESVVCRIILDKKVNDLGLAMTSSFTNMITAGHCLAHIFELEKYEQILQSLAQEAMDNLENISELAIKIAENDYDRICFLGSGTLKAVADESALKVLELSGGKYSVMSESFLGLRHGPLSWLNTNSLVVGFVSNDLEKQKIELGLLSELKQKNAAKDILAVLPNDSVNVSDICDYKITFNFSNDLFDDYCSIIYVLFAQLLGLYASLNQNLKPDSPSADGKIQRVVSTVNFQ